ncbi:hypothetical protein WJX74_008987 [Apatococcus lobatus]|uniref:Nucleolar complex protein 3 homolog n=1 Tax=Apatococcus lobatus TaxID=904363 RepID=A0AAW1SG77_9CHLO
MRKPTRKPQHEKTPLPSTMESDLEVSDEDLAFVDDAAEDLGFLRGLDASTLHPGKRGDKGDLKTARRAAAEAAEVDTATDEEAEAAAALPSGRRKRKHAEDTEPEFEKPRQKLSTKQSREQKLAEQLPIRNLTGELVYQGRGLQQPSEALQQLAPGITVTDDAAEAAATAAEEDLDDASEEELPEMMIAKQMEEAAAEAAGRDQPMSKKERKRLKRAMAQEKATAIREEEGVAETELEAFQKEEERQEANRQQIAMAASHVLQEPEGQLGDLRLLVTLASDKDPQTARLASLSLLAVFRDILPGYRIRLPTEKEQEVVVSKDVKRLRDYESTLLRCYQAYLKALLAASRPGKATPGGPVGQRVATKCLCGLLVAVPHFNYSQDLLQAIVPLLANQDEAQQRMAAGAVKEVLAGDLEGSLSLTAVQLIADLVRRKNCMCPPHVAAILLSVNVGEVTLLDKEDAKGKHKAKRRKKGRKDDVAAAFKEADAGPDVSATRMAQSAILEALFETFFRVIKHCTASGLVNQASTGKQLGSGHLRQRFPLLLPALQGLTHFAHRLSLEYFGDLIAALLQLVKAPNLPTLERLHCLLAVSDILRGQGEALTIDRRELHLQLYSLLLDAPLQPLAAEEDDPLPDDPQLAADASEAHNRSQGGRRADEDGLEPRGQLLVRLVGQAVLDGGRSMDPARLASMTKRLACTALQSGVGEVMGLLASLDRMLRSNGRLRGMLEQEAGVASWGAGLSGAAEEGSQSDALTGAPLWELSLAVAHFHPHVAQAAASISTLPPDSAPTTICRLLAVPEGPAGLAAAYSPAQGTFKPPPQMPRKHRPLDTRTALRLAQSLPSFSANDDNADASAGGTGSNIFGAVFRSHLRLLENARLRKQCRSLKRLLELESSGFRPEKPPQT